METLLEPDVSVVSFFGLSEHENNENSNSSNLSFQDRTSLLHKNITADVNETVFHCWSHGGILCKKYINSCLYGENKTIWERKRRGSRQKKA